MMYKTVLLILLSLWFLKASGQEGSDGKAYNYHISHPGEFSSPGDPNAAFCINNTYHLHYILKHPWEDQVSYAYIHLTSSDMLHWEWQPTKLQHSFTGHGMFSGTGFLTKEGTPAIIYHGRKSGRNQIVFAKNNKLTAWHRPRSIEVKNTSGNYAEIKHWDPDCFRVDSTYYAISGGIVPPLFKSDNLEDWQLVGDFMPFDMTDVSSLEDISCPNFFQIGGKWILLCISHPFGARYYIGDWHKEKEQFIPEKHGRLNWRRNDQSFEESRDIFAPESVLTPDGRRVMWAWIASLGHNIGQQTVMTLPREIWLSESNDLRIRPIKELQTLRYNPVTITNFPITGKMVNNRIATLENNSYEIYICINRAEAMRKHFGINIFSDEKGSGMPIRFNPQYNTVLVGKKEIPFNVSWIEESQDLEISIFVDNHLVEVFVNDRIATVSTLFDFYYGQNMDIYGYTHTDWMVKQDTIMIKKMNIWELKPTNEGYNKAQEKQVWKPKEN